DWPEEARAALQRSLDRRYLLRRIETIHGLRTAGDRLEFVVDTDCGPATFRIDPRGEAGARRAIEILAGEFERSLMLCGVPRAADIGADLLAP
ncbi:MAG TPA: DUF1854 domain-containing protein, partial [Burkholderiales bacterium]|nr:DUF1854 domain-containing protein [Burkholderiales bacterium]